MLSCSPCGGVGVVLWESEILFLRCGLEWGVEGEARDLWQREDSLLALSGSQHEFKDSLGNKQGRNPILVHLLFTINAVSCILLTYKPYNTNPIIPEK